MNPLKFLDAYQRSDHEIFFGRDTETEELYNKVKKSRLFVLYGLSGTGKTSVVRCGLGNKFDPVDCLEIYVRRENHILNSMRKSIQEAADTFISPDTKNIEALRLLYLETLRPIFLIFDQFEEIFISGKKDELVEFCLFLQSVLLEQSINVNILIIIREEYMGQLEKLEPYLPEIYLNKQRLERMHSSTVHDVVKKILTCGEIEYNDLTLPQSIVENAGIKNNVIDLPYLQVYLDRLFKVVHSDKRTPGAQLTNDHIREVGKLEELLGDFLEKQLTIISAQQKERDTEFGWRLLKKMITPEATKKLVSVVALTEDVFGKDEISKADESKLNAYLSHLRDSRIIRMIGDGQMEIAHDALGIEIAKKRTPEELKILESERIVRSKYQSMKAKIKDDLTNAQVRYIYPYVSKLKLEPEESEFIRQSIRRNQVKNRTNKTLAAAGILLLMTLTGIALGGWVKANNEKIRANNERIRANIERDNAKSEKAKAERARLSEKAAKDDAERKTVIAEKKTKESDSIAQELAINSHQLKIALSAAEESAIRATENKIKADSNATKANHQERLAKQEKNKTESVNLALQSLLETDSETRLIKALKGYYLNEQFNDNRWLPEIVTALLNSNPGGAIQPLAPINSPLVDVVNVRNLFIAVTDLGKFQLIDLNKGAGEILSKQEADFYYVNNSAQFDSLSNELIVVDKRKIVHRFFMSNTLFQFKEKKRSDMPDSVVSVRGKYMLTAHGVIESEKDKFASIIKFNDQQFGSRLELCSSNGILAAGTTNGWLYVLRPNRKNYFRGQFQNQNTSIIDIAFDKHAEFIATGGMDSKFRLAKVNQMNEKLPIEWTFKSWVMAVLFVGDMKALIGTSDGKLFLFDYNHTRLAEKCCDKLRMQLDQQRRSGTDSIIDSNCLKKWL